MQPQTPPAANAGGVAAARPAGTADDASVAPPAAPRRGCVLVVDLRSSRAARRVGTHSAANAHIR
eukprot:5802999-Prymnesium_polylepis.1